MMGDLLVPTGQVNELLGVRDPAAGPILPNMPVNLRKLNVTEPGPAQGEWVDLHAVLHWMRLWNEKVGGDRTLAQMIRQYREVLEV